MVKNIVIGVLVAISLGFFFYAHYQQTLIERVLNEAEACTLMAEKNQVLAKRSAEEALTQKIRAEQALNEAERQRARLEEKLQKCK